MRIFVAGGLIVSLLWPFFSFAPPVEAHIGGGPPFVSVDGLDAQTNAEYLSGPAFQIPWDLDHQLHLVNKPIHFAINLHNLPVPYDIAQQTSFRWTWDENGTDTTTGTDVTHTYSKLGSHLVSLDVLPPGETEWMNYDTIRINVVPSSSYKLPKIQLSVVKGKFTTNQPISFISSVETDPSTKLASQMWDFGDSTTSKEANPTHTYTDSDFLHFAYIQVKDRNGLTQEDGITLAGNKGTITLSPLIATASAIPLVDPASTSRGSGTPFSWTMTLGGIAAAIVLIVGGLVVLKRKPKSKASQKVDSWS